MGDRNPPHDLTDERTTLVAYLDYLRESVTLKLHGLSEEDARRPTLRWILIHMIEETGRHAGRAGIVRELIDGVIGG